MNIKPYGQPEVQLLKDKVFKLFLKKLFLKNHRFSLNYI